VDQAPWTAQLVLMLVLLNAINLVPILPLDGGRLFETLVFARWPVLDVGFRVVTIAALGWLGVNGEVLFGVLAALFLLSLRYHARIAFDAARLRRERPWPADPQALTDADLLALHTAARAAMPTAGAPRNRTVLQAAVQLFDRVARRPATVLQTLLLLLAWFLGLVLAAGEFIWVMVHA
ncbi:MAG TPA: hypothetical protein VFT55_15605, partial [Planctomycetota bacterium]|nr:hypothetical protein [Planctomycetota bacterium]